MGKNLLIDERPLVLLPSLAKIIGVDLAIVVQQLHFYLDNPKSGKMINGERWIWNTYEEWQKESFPFWSTRTIRRLFTEAEEKSLIVSSQPEGWDSRRKYYRLNVGMMAKLTRPLADSIDVENEGLPSGQKARIDAAKKRGSNAAKSGASLIIDRDFSTETSRVSEREKKRAEAEQIYDQYPLHVGRPFAMRAILRALKTSPFSELLARTKAFAGRWNGELTYCPHPSTWFNQARYNDDPKTWQPRTNGTKPISAQTARKLPTSAEAYQQG